VFLRCFLIGLEAFAIPMIQLEMNFKHMLDFDRIKHAFLLLLDKERVLGCRFIEQGWHGFWKRLTDSELSKAVFMIENRDEYEKARHTLIDYHKGPQIICYLYRHENMDTLLLKVSHVAADAGGTKHAAYLLADIYNELAKDPGYIPPPNAGASRSMLQPIRKLKWWEYFSIIRNLIQEIRRQAFPVATHRLYLSPCSRHSEIKYCSRTISTADILKLKTYCHERNSTLNDLMLAAYLRASSKRDWDGKSQLRLGITVDLRRYLSNETADGICNLSGFEYINLGLKPGHSFEETLQKICTFTSGRKNSFLGLNGYPFLPILALFPLKWVKKLMEKALFGSYQRGNISNILTNMGPINYNRLDFDGPPLSARLLLPPVIPPMFGMGISGYRDTLTLSTCSYTATGIDFNDIIDSILAELPLKITPEV